MTTTIHKKETKALRKRPQFIVGLILWAGLMFYFLFKTYGVEHWITPKTSDIIGIAAGLLTAIIVIWLLLRYVLKTTFLKTFFLFFTPIMLFIMLTNTQAKTFNVEYLISSVASLLAFVFLNDSIREYFCERLLEEQKERQINKE